MIQSTVRTILTYFFTFGSKSFCSPSNRRQQFLVEASVKWGTRCLYLCFTSLLVAGSSSRHSHKDSGCCCSNLSCQLLVTYHFHNWDVGGPPLQHGRSSTNSHIRKAFVNRHLLVNKVISTLCHISSGLFQLGFLKLFLLMPCCAAIWVRPDVHQESVSSLCVYDLTFQQETSNSFC